MISAQNTDIAQRWVGRSELADIYEKVVAGKRLSREDGLRLFESQDLLTIGFLANCGRDSTVRKPIGSITSISTTATSAPMAAGFAPLAGV